MSRAISTFVLKNSGFLGLLSVLLLCHGVLPGQTSLSTIRGTVTDASAAVVAGVTVTAEETTTGVKARTVTTDNQGNYEMPDLVSGTYRLTATLSGFKTFVANNVVLESNQTLRVDMSLQVGDTSTQITISGSAAVINTEEGKIAAEFTAQQYKDVPIPGNAYSSPIPVLVTMPQVQTDEGSYNVYFAGQGGAQLDMGMDGVKEETMNTQTVNMESVEEVKVVVVNNSAEFARVGYYDTVTKHGTNQFHGEGSYYHRNSALGARSFFSPDKPRVIYHTFTAAASGPIIKDRTFFYVMWNGERVPGGEFHLANVPTNLMRTGDFSELLTQSPPVTITDPLTGQPFSGNVIPTSRLSATALKLQNDYLPTPDMGGPHDLANNFGFKWPYPDDQYHADVVTTRIDHKLSAKNSLYGRFSAYLPRYVLVGNYPDLFWTRLRQSHSWAIVDTHVFSPSLVNTFTFGGNRDRVLDGTTVGGHAPIRGDKVVADLGLTGVNPSNLSAMGFPVMDITGYCGTCVYAGTLNVGYGGGVTLLNRNFTYADSLSWARGRHIIKAGGELRTYRNFDGSVPQNTYGYFSFNGSFTGDAYADFLLGLPFTSQRLTPLINRVQREKESGLFVTDTFKVSSRLTLDLGLRWDYFGSPSYEDGLQYTWDPKTGDVIVPSSAMSKVSPLYPGNVKVVAGQVVPNAGKGDFRPRLAAAYRITPKTVVRGGYGIFTEVRGTGSGLYAPDGVLAQGGGPFAIGETYYNSIQNGQPLFSLPNPFPANAGSAVIPSQSVTGYPLDTRHGMIHQFNVTLEHEVRDIGIRLSYVGSRSRDLNYFIELDKPEPSLVPFTDSRRPYTQFVSTSWNRSNGAADYNSMSFEAQRRVGQVTFDASWTWARNMVNFLNLENPYAPLYWNRDSNPEHRVVYNVIWDVPVGRKARFLNQIPRGVDQVIGGWKLYWVGFLQTGHYFTPYFSGSDPSNTNSYGGLPDRIANGNLPTDKRTLDQWFDVSAFTIPPDGRFGNSGVNILEGPGLNVQNLNVAKTFRLTERFSFHFMTMISNLFNHPNFYSPPSDITVPGQAGVIGAGGGQHGFFSAEKSGPRMIELRGRIEF